MAARMAVVHRPAGEASFLRAKKAPSLEPAPLKAMTEKDFDFINRMDSDVEGRRRTAFMEQLKKDPRFRPEMLEPAKSKFQVQRWLASAIALRRVRGAHASLSPSLSVLCRLSRSWVGRSSRRTSQPRTGMRGRSTSGGRSAAGAPPCPPHRIHAVIGHKLIALLCAAGIDQGIQQQQQRSSSPLGVSRHRRADLSRCSLSVSIGRKLRLGSLDLQHRLYRDWDVMLHERHLAGSALAGWRARPAQIKGYGVALFPYTHRKKSRSAL
jgi:hypothetical protein